MPYIACHLLHLSPQILVASYSDINLGRHCPISLMGKGNMMLLMHFWACGSPHKLRSWIRDEDLEPVHQRQQGRAWCEKVPCAGHSFLQTAPGVLLWGHGTVTMTITTSRPGQLSKSEKYSQQTLLEFQWALSAKGNQQPLVLNLCGNLWNYRREVLLPL